ncbi:MAG TPA: hypothetical protein VF058_00035 [Actinomycetota bacterium]
MMRRLTALLGLAAVLTVAPMSLAGAITTAGGGTDAACELPGQLVQADREVREACSARVASVELAPVLPEAESSGFPIGWTAGGGLVLLFGVGVLAIAAQRHRRPRVLA